MDCRRWANYSNLEDPWLPQGSLCSYIEGPLLLHDEDRRVSSLRTNHSWSFNSLNLPFPLNFKTLFKVFLWHNLLESLTLLCGPTTTVLV